MRRPMRWSAGHGRTLVGVMVLLVALSAGCSQSEDDTAAVEASRPPADAETEVEAAGTDAERWADEVCTAAVGWESDVSAAIANLPQELVNAASVEDAVSSVGSTLQQVADASTEAASAIADAELPDTENRDALRTELDTIEAAVDEAGAAAEDVAAADSDLPTFLAAGQAAVDTFEQSLTEVSEAWGRIDQLDLGEETEQALRDNPDCAILLSG